MKKIFITGGGGYVGSVLIPKLLDLNYYVTVYDLFLYGEDKLDNHKNLNKIKADIRSTDDIEISSKYHDVFLHLACISNDPSFELNPSLGKSINLDAFEPIVKVAKKNNIAHFIFASSSSVYGLKDEKNVTEDIDLEPLTDYSKYKVEGEKILNKHNSKNFHTTIIRPATVCGYGKRQRLDVVVNILTSLAFYKNEITVFGGDQLRPNIHIQDMAQSYIDVIESPMDKVSKQTFNVGYDNMKVIDIGNTIKNVIGENVKLIRVPTDDNRSYHISSKKIYDIIGFKPKHTVNDAILDLKNAFEKKLLTDPLNNVDYYNIKLMQKINLL
jgi:nucleoside-diphosphate-sugar epimerase